MKSNLSNIVVIAVLGILGVACATSVSAQSPAIAPLGIGLESYEYPFPVHFLDFDMQGQFVRMAYMDVPASGNANGSTVVLLHGKNFGGYYFANLIKHLSAEGYRVIAPDQIGWGKSSKPDLRYSFQNLAANTVQLLDHLGVSRIVLLGHSTGGMLAVRFARSYPERVDRLILEDPIGLEDYRMKAPAQTDETLFKDELKKTDTEKIRAFYAKYFAHPNPDVFGPLAEVQIRTTMSGEFPRLAKASALAYQMIYEQPVVYDYAYLEPPTLLVLGDADHTAPFSNYATPEVQKTMGHVVELGKELIKKVPHGKLVVIEQSGHIPHMEQPDAFQQALDGFLREPKSRN
ncbi:MAG TPA: alpha/beta hydrolase [Terriglobales bacterium]|nr:alpha/beta hydrolase [Terriglobales bacterium]